MEKTVENLLGKLEKSSKKYQKMTLKDCLLDFNQFLKKEKEVFSIDSFQKEMKYQDFTEAEDYDEYCKINLSLATTILEKKIDELNKTGLNYHNILKYKEYLKVFISDLKSIIEYLHKDDSDYNFVNNSYPALNSERDLLEAAYNLLYPFKCLNIQHTYLDNISLANVIIRQVIEVRIKRFLGIWKINKKSCDCRDFSYSALIDFIKQNNQYFDHSLDFDNIKTIYKWSCNCIHNAIRPKIWVLENAFIELGEFFKPGSINDQNGFQWSIDGAMKINNYDDMKEKLTNQYSRCYCFKFINPNSLIRND